MRQKKKLKPIKQIHAPMAGRLLISFQGMTGASSARHTAKTVTDGHPQMEIRLLGDKVPKYNVLQTCTDLNRGISKLPFLHSLALQCRLSKAGLHSNQLSVSFRECACESFCSPLDVGRQRTEDKG